MTQSYVLHKSDPRRDAIRANLHAFVDRLPETKSWRVDVKEYRKDRTDAQNAALFGVAYPAFRDTGYTPDELHDAFCRRFFGTVEREVMGETVVVPRRTTTRDSRGARDVISRDDFSDFYRMVQQVGAEAGIDVPDPDPMHGVGT